MPKLVSPQDALALWKEQELRPLKSFTKANDPWPSECLRCGDTVAPTYNDVRRGKSRCSQGCKRRAIAAKLAFTDTRAREIMVEGGWIPVAYELYRDANAAWTCRCTSCGAVRQKQLSHVKDGRARCDRCAEREVVTPRKALVLFESHGLRPDLGHAFPGTQKPWPSTCMTCGSAITTVTYSKLKQKAAYKGCRGCGAGNGMNLANAGYLYLVEHHALQALKIGIAESPYRIKQHQEQGWQLVQKWPFDSGHAAKAVEQGVIGWWKSLGLSYEVLREVMRYGYTETVSSRFMTAQAVRAAVTCLIQGKEVPSVLGEFRLPEG